jgi:ribosomal protein S16
MAETEFARAERYWHETCRLTEEIRVLRGALEPFAEVAKNRRLTLDDNTIWSFGFSGAQLAEAARALAKSEDKMTNIVTKDES